MHSSPENQPMTRTFCLLLALLGAGTLSEPPPVVHTGVDAAWRLNDFERSERYRYQHHLRTRFERKAPRAQV
jgi:hypothetical protein